MTTSKMMTFSEAAALIEAGEVLLVAGDTSVLRKLPKGRWIGGSIPYFMSDEGGVVDHDRVFVNALPAGTRVDKTVLYDAEGLKRVYEDGSEDGLAFVIIPASSEVHLDFAKEAQNYPGFLSKPLMGWISGVHLDDLGTVPPVVIDGMTGEVSDARAAVLHAKLPEGMSARVDIVNIFTPGDGDTITFDEVGFDATFANVNGARVPFAKYLLDKGVDPKLPLVADYYGAMVNVSFQSVDADSGKVALYAPVFPGIEYRIAKPVDDYVAGFESALPEAAAGATFACNCILNFLYGDLEGKRTKDAVGPITFGEIAYQLLDQTFVYLEVDE